MKVKIDIGTVDSKGHVTIRYSEHSVKCFNTEEEARLFGEGVLCGLDYKWKNPAVVLRIEGKDCITIF